MNYWSYLQLQQIKYQLHSIYGPSVNMVLVIVVLPPIILIMIGFYKKKSIKFSNHGLSVHRTNYLENKIFLISFDNTSNNIKSIDNFTLALNPIMDGRKFHKKYACHILNLTFKASLKIIAINNLICKFKDGIHHIYSNNIKK
jgi:hypothetical protein